MQYANKITFFERFEADIVAGKKVITIRDESENNYLAGSVVDVATYEDGRQFCQIKIESVKPILFDNLTEFHAQQENMTLTQLKQVITEIYPGVQQLYVINYLLVI
ncbi:N(4)-acetylcytidine aminohydrolase [Vibrio tapetis subsp. quintayensis]|uniref:N(4)-acetylcytidine aminohydrolase n=1 Tax=Vibrio tapetis TaxID=52443 RepID=UPI0025B5E65D|nr:N(4)-acetylcytidine aminohydrolase [Vibrio tapetis]MDN3679980.1 N(4)-acetylcytidine aminohydrolase [Vibrio tapetis subsp. quintayensis]